MDSDMRNVNVVIDLNKAITTKGDSINIQPISFVPLETTPESTIGQIGKVIFRHNKLYIADFDLSKALFVFDMQGKFLFKIDRSGRGPGEYTNFFDFDILNNGDICMWDVETSQFLFFSPEGQFHHGMKMKYKFMNFCILDDQYYLANTLKNGKVKANLEIYNITTKTYKEIISERGLFDHLEFSRYSSYYFFYSDSTVYYAPRFSEIIYSINRDGIKPHIGLENLSIPSQNVLQRWITGQESQVADTQNLKDIIYIYENEDYVVFSMVIVYPQQMVYQKHTGKVYSMPLMGDLLSINSVVACYNDQFVAIAHDGEDARNILKKEHVTVTEDSNPVLVFFNFKL